MRMFRLCANGLVSTALVLATSAAEFPFVISYDGGVEGGATDVSSFRHAPAGKFGFVRVEGEKFATDAGEQRFFGVNMTGPANFPSREDADATAERLARLGVNCVRMHFLDVWYSAMFDEPQQCLLAEKGTCRKLSAAQLDKMDYFVAALKKRGIYVNLNLHVGRVPGPEDGFPPDPPRYGKGVMVYYPGLRPLFKEYCRDLLAHVNAYTGNAYRDESAVAMMEIDNEQSVFQHCMKGEVFKIGKGWRDELERQWNAWRRKNRGATDALPIPKRLEAAPGVWYDFYLFLTEIDAEYYRDMYAYLKDELKVKSPVSGSQAHYSTALNQLGMDYIDEHAYWRHPSGVTGTPSRPEKWWVVNDAMVNSLGVAIGKAEQRVFGRPYVMSEYNHPTPNQYGAEGMPMISMMCALQGWSGVFHYTYNHFADGMRSRMNPWSVFDFLARTDMLAHYPACAAMVLRGDLKPLTREWRWGVSKETAKELFGIRNRINAVYYDVTCRSFVPPEANPLLFRTGIDYSGPAATTGDWFDTPQRCALTNECGVTWDRSVPDRCCLVVNTPRTKVFTGYPEGRTIALGVVTLKDVKTSMDWATVSLVSLDGKAFDEAGARILVAATAKSGNTDEKLAFDETGTKVTYADRGRAPVVNEGVAATLGWAVDPSRLSCWALGERGERKAKVPVQTSEGGAMLALSPDWRTVWYEVKVD